MDKIAIVGIGGAGVNVVELFAQKTQGKYYCVAMDTSTNAFGIVKHFSKKLQLGPKTCEGLGAVEYEKGRAAAVESEKDITELFKGFERIIFVSGLSGGCGGGAGPEIAKIANMLKIKTTYLAFCISSKIPQIIALEPDKKSLVVFEEIKQYADQAIPIFPGDVVNSDNILEYFRKLDRLVVNRIVSLLSDDEFGFTINDDLFVQEGKLSIENKRDSKLIDILNEKLKTKTYLNRIEITDRLMTELKIIFKLGKESVFLAFNEIIEMLKREKMPFFCSGAMNSSLVLHILGIVNEDPLTHGLIFERFLNTDNDLFFGIVMPKNSISKFIAKIFDNFKYHSIADQSVYFDGFTITFSPLEEIVEMYKNLEGITGMSLSAIAAKIAMERLLRYDIKLVFLHLSKIETPSLRQQLEPILEENCGAIIFQEQVMKILSAVCGWDMEKADLARKKLAKRSDNGAFFKSFMDDALNAGVSRADAEYIYHTLEDVAKYTFCKAHAIAEASYISANWKKNKNQIESK